MTIKIVIGILIFISILVLFFAIKTKKPFKVLFKSGAAGIVTLILLSITKYFIGIGLKLNLYTALCSFILGIPGVITMLLTNIIWNI